VLDAHSRVDISESRIGASSVPEGEHFDPAVAWQNAVIKVIADARQEHAAHAADACLAGGRARGRLEREKFDRTLQLLGNCARCIKAVGTPLRVRLFDLTGGAEGELDGERGALH
jgi:uncharacterized metal-binding protein YceD (DUF177 family)